MDRSIEDQFGTDSIYHYSNSPDSSSPTAGDVDEAAFPRGGPDGIFDPTSSGIWPTPNALRSDVLYHNVFQHQPSLFTPANFSSTETSLLGISPNGYDGGYYTSVEPSNWPLLDCVLEFQGPGDGRLV
jgi:hypothetical protein